MRGRLFAVVGFVVLVIGSTVAAGQLFGSWSVLARFGAFQPLGSLLFDSVLEIDYTTCRWAVGATARFLRDEFDFLFFDTSGNLGAVELFSIASFHPSPDLVGGEPYFQWAWGSAELTVGGVTVYALPMISNWGFSVPGARWGHVQGVWGVLVNDVGISLVVGGWGNVGECSVWAQAAFNSVVHRFGNSNRLIALKGYDWFLEHGKPHPYCDKYGLNSWTSGRAGFLAPQTPGCSLPWSSANVIVKAPFGCLDLLSMIDFTCEKGFNWLSFLVEGIDLGLSWLELAYVDIQFDVNEKTVDSAFDLVVTECLCFTPYLSVVAGHSDTELSGIALNAITVDYEMGQGITFKAGHRFTNLAWDIYFDPYFFTYQRAFSPWGEVFTGSPIGAFCPWNLDYDEYFAIEVDGDSCCGGLFDAWIYSWFDVDQPGTVFMDWAETVVGVDVVVGSNTTLAFHTGLKNMGLNFLDIGIKFIW